MNPYFLSNLSKIGLKSFISITKSPEVNLEFRILSKSLIWSHPPPDVQYTDLKFNFSLLTSNYN